MYKLHHNLPLKMNNSSLYVIDDEIKALKDELEEFLDGMLYMNSKKFSQDVLFSHEIQANNIIEGYQDDVSLVDSVIHQKLNINDEKRKKRILNLYRGYQYILKGKELNKDNLRELYQILSDGLLEPIDVANMGKYYRNNPVYIYFSDRFDVEPDQGMPANELDDYMNSLFEYISGPHKNECLTDIYVVSQILHFYFCYIHPYYDINGRTSRTTAMWYLLNKEAYPYIIFNRGIQYAKQEYYRVIRDVIKYKNVTFFLNYMMKSLKKELEKEHIMEMINQSVNESLTPLDYQTLQYILTMRGKYTFLDFATFYNRHNEHRSKKDIIETMLIPLIDKGVIKSTGVSKHHGGINHFFDLNDKMYELDPNKVKRIYLAKR